MEKLYIHNFAGIKELEIEWTKINLLIGPQASGKSIAVKLTYFFKKFYQYVEKNLFFHNNLDDLDTELSNTFSTYFPPSTWQNKDFEIIFYLNKKSSIKLFNKSSSLKFIYSKEIENAIHETFITFSKFLKEYNVSDYKSLIFFSDFRAEYKKLLKKHGFSFHKDVFIPAGRSFFANIQSNIFRLINENFSLDPFLKEFGSTYELYKHRRPLLNEIYSKDLKKHIDLLFSKVLHGKYIFENHEQFIIHPDGRKVNLLYASSGQQEIVPLLIILENSYYDKKNSVDLYIEEPEAHLFPEAQYNIVKILARVFNTDNDYQYFITTHSPYILAAFNNLLYAGILENKLENKEDVYRIIPKEEIITPGLLKAFGMEYGGKISLIMDKETGLIDQNILDDVSDIVADEFDKLLNIEFTS